MTEEDRILYLEQQRLAEEEMRKKKEDMLTQFLKVRQINNQLLHKIEFFFICKLHLLQLIKIFSAMLNERILELGLDLLFCGLYFLG